jgi:hypothetical protein
LFAHAGARQVGRVEDLWDHAERYRMLHVRTALEHVYAEDPTS